MLRPWDIAITKDTGPCSLLKRTNNLQIGLITVGRSAVEKAQAKSL